MSESTISAHEEPLQRRDFIFITTAAVGAVGTALAVWPFIDSLNPTADVLSFSTVEVDLAPIQPGQRLTVKWRNQPVCSLGQVSSVVGDPS